MPELSAGKTPASISSRARHQRLALVAVEQRAELLGHRRDHARHVREPGRRDRLAAELPDHRAELRIDVERESVVDRIDRSLAEEAVPALAIGVVREQIEEADLLQALVVRGILTQREVVLLEIRRHELLQRAVAEGAF